MAASMRCGRTDYQSGDAGALYDSIVQHLYTLPDETVVYPGHGSVDRMSSTIGAEKYSNARIRNGVDRDAFIMLMNSLKLDPPERMHEVLPSNLRCGIHAWDNNVLARC